MPCSLVKKLGKRLMHPPPFRSSRADMIYGFSVARWRLSPPDLDNSGGFESCLAGKKYFWRTPNFRRISGGFDQFCMVVFLPGAT
jgi:hypothetical protein